MQVPSLTLANTTGQDAHINGAYQTIAADLAGATVPGGHVVTFTVTGMNPGTYQGTTSGGGIATFNYQGHAGGTDTIVATTTVDGFSVTSLPLTLVWTPQIDLATPTISFSYTVSARQHAVRGRPGQAGVRHGDRRPSVARSGVRSRLP